MLWNPELERFERGAARIVVRGRLSFASQEGEAQPEHVDWPQALTVPIARRPGERPHWDFGYDENDTAIRHVFTTPAGEFACSLQAHELQRELSRAGKHRVGLNLGSTRRGIELVWTPADPLVDTSLGEVEVRGPEPLDEMHAILNGVGEINAPPSIPWRWSKP